MERNVSLTRVQDRVDPFAELTYALASTFLNRATEAHFASARLFMEGDHWQQGKGWVGPHPGIGETGFSEVMAKIQEAFVSYNAIREIVERHRSAVIGKLPVWALTVRRPMKSPDDKPTTAEQALIDEAAALLKPWLATRRVHRKFQDAVDNALWSGRGPLRLYVPSGLLDEQEGEEGAVELVANAKNMTDAINLLWLEAPDPEAATVFIDPSSQLSVGITSYKPTLDRTFIATGITVYEVSYVDRKSENTVVRRMDPQGEGNFEFDFGGRLPIFEMLLNPLVTEQLIQGQKALNLALSMLPRTIVTAGFVEMIILNGQMPGYPEVDDKGNKTGRWVMGSFKRGAGTVNWIKGEEVEQPDGKMSRATPDVKFRELPDVKPIVETAHEHYSSMLGEAKQAHIVANQAADASGFALQQRRADFEASLQDTVTEIQLGWNWMIETALAFAEAILGQPGKYTTQLQATTSCRVNTGPLSPAERAQNAADVESGLLSPETAMQASGIDDVDGEMQRINTQKQGQLAFVAEQSSVILGLVQAGVPLEIAAEMAKVDNKLVAKLNLVEPPPEPTPTGSVA